MSTFARRGGVVILFCMLLAACTAEELMPTGWVGSPASLAVRGPVRDTESRDINRVRILVTNDDGINAPGLRLLAKELSEFADVIVCAPEENRSGSSQSVTYFSRIPMRARDVEIDGAVRAVAVSGTPADAAHFGITHLGRDEPFDLLISGMNRGANVGDLSHGSGTVGAAMEGSFRGVPSIAVSADSRLRDLIGAARFARRFAEHLLERGPDAGVVYSINIPAPGAKGEWPGVRPAAMGGSYLSASSYQERPTAEGDVLYTAVVAINEDVPDGTDTRAYLDGFITITPLRFDWTHREALEELSHWEWALDDLR